jgi:hypothetical protein
VLCKHLLAVWDVKTFVEQCNLSRFTTLSMCTETLYCVLGELQLVLVYGFFFLEEGGGLFGGE